MNRLHASLLIFCLLVAACGSVPPAPTDRYYRLQAVSVPSAKVLSGAVGVQTFRADSLYAERPIVYAEESGLRQLRQYHYHLWLYPPARMVQSHLTASLGSVLDLSGGNTAPDVLEGRVLSFERVLSGRNSKAVVALELSLKTGEKVRLSKLYQAEQAATDDSLGSFVVAMEQALGKIYTEFLIDADRSRSR